MFLVRVYDKPVKTALVAARSPAIVGRHRGRHCAKLHSSGSSHGITVPHQGLVP